MKEKKAKENDEENEIIEEMKERRESVNI